MVHMVRNSLKYVPYKDRKAVAADLKKIYTAASESAPEEELTQFAQRWDAKYPMISRSWKLRWAEVVSFFKYPEPIRKVIYTTNAIESLNYSIRRITKNRLSFPTTDAALKLVFMGLQHISKKWTMPIRDWGYGNASIQHLLWRSGIAMTITVYTKLGIGSISFLFIKIIIFIQALLNIKQCI